MLYPEGFPELKPKIPPPMRDSVYPSVPSYRLRIPSYGAPPPRYDIQAFRMTWMNLLKRRIGSTFYIMKG